MRQEITRTIRNYVEKYKRKRSRISSDARIEPMIKRKKKKKKKGKNRDRDIALERRR